MIRCIIVVSAFPPTTAKVERELTTEQRSTETGHTASLTPPLVQSHTEFLRHGENKTVLQRLKPPTHRYVLSSLKGESLISCAYVVVNSNMISHWRVPSDLCLQVSAFAVCVCVDQCVRGKKRRGVAVPASIHFNH